MKKIAILASGNGSNAENITRFFNEGNRLRVELLLVDRKEAPVIQRLEPFGVETVYYPRKLWKEDVTPMVELLRSHEIDLVVLAGFNTILRPEFVEAFDGRILNIHPSLLPEFGGAGMWGGNVHQAVLEAGKDRSGATVHYVSNEVDAGEILMQQSVTVFPDDTPETLEQRVHEAEYSLYPRAIVEALRRLETPPSVDFAWASCLKEEEVPDVPESLQQNTEDHGTPTPPPIGNGATPPPIAGIQQQNINRECADASNNQAAQAQKHPPMPKTYLVWSVLMTILCCFIPGIIAIFCSSRVSSLYFAGDYEGAERASRQAEIWIIVSFCLGVLSATVYMPLSILFR